MLTRRGLLKGTVVMMAAPAEVKILDRVTLSRFDFESGDVTGWTTVAGTWTVEEMDGAPSGRRVLVQRSTGHAFNVIVAPPGPSSDIDASVKFKPRGCVGGIVVRFGGGRYYVVRANALEDNLRLYHYERRRRQLATADVKAPALGQWHTLRILGDHLQSWLDGRLLLDHHDTRSRAGQVGLWTKADSITAFDDLSIRGS